MFVVNDRIQIPDEELQFSFARSGGPGGQNVNKVSSKAILRWDLRLNTTVPIEVKDRLRALQRNRVTVEGELVIQAQNYRDQERNKLECLERLREMLLEAASLPKKRRPSRPTRGSKERRLKAKKHRSSLKSERGKLNFE
jgi:ribosome-associated protein